MMKKINHEYSEYMKVGFIQTRVDGEMAWFEPEPSLTMRHIVAVKVWQEIKKGFINLKDYDSCPDLIVLPELTIPHGYVNDLQNLSKEIGAVVIAGMDFEKVDKNCVRNKAIVIVPSKWLYTDKVKSRKTSTFYFGKTYQSEEEEELFEKVNYTFYPDRNTYILNAGKFGNIGVAICSDFFDIERFVIYRGQIQHMIVISHNKDTNSYYFLAEAISRLVYCNVIICNTGYYGDSLAFSPYKEKHDRVIYRHEGKNIFTTQVVILPVQALVNAQRGNNSCKLFKGKPPGYRYRNRI